MLVKYIQLFISIIVLQICYFLLADHFDIVDRPNERSSHNDFIIRGGGIIFALAAFLWFGVYGFHYHFMILGLMSIVAISFWDDIQRLSGILRIVVHLFAVSLLFAEVALFVLPWYIVIIAFILTVGWINAFNFMDGINGITPFYSFVALTTLLWLNQQIAFASDEFLFVLLFSVFVFGYFNARKRAKCFAGDVGSISMSFLLSWLMIGLMLKTVHWEYIVFFGVYGVDSVLTITHRLYKRENIFQAHRNHLYQCLSNECRWPHLVVSGLYALVQLVINIGLIFVLKWFSTYSVVYVFVSMVLLSMLYIGSKYFILNSVRIPRSKNLV